MRREVRNRTHGAASPCLSGGSVEIGWLQPDSRSYGPDGLLKTCNLSRSMARNSPCEAVHGARLQVLHTPSALNRPSSAGHPLLMRPCFAMNGSSVHIRSPPPREHVACYGALVVEHLSLAAIRKYAEVRKLECRSIFWWRERCDLVSSPGHGSVQRCWKNSSDGPRFTPPPRGSTSWHV